MKGRHIKILTIFGLIAIIALQTIWLCNAYIQFSQSIYKDSNDILKKSLNREASIRFEKMGQTGQFFEIENCSPFDKQRSEPRF